MIDVANALARPRTTNFRGRGELFDALLRRHKRCSQTCTPLPLSTVNLRVGK
jgi:hypothetical protein